MTPSPESIEEAHQIEVNCPHETIAGNWCPLCIASALDRYKQEIQRLKECAEAEFQRGEGYKAYKERFQVANAGLIQQRQEIESLKAKLKTAREALQVFASRSDTFDPYVDIAKKAIEQIGEVE